MGRGRFTVSLSLNPLCRSRSSGPFPSICRAGGMGATEGWLKPSNQLLLAARYCTWTELMPTGRGAGGIEFVPIRGTRSRGPVNEIVTRNRDSI